jgi:hypothetical protein
MLLSMFNEWYGNSFRYRSYKNYLSASGEKPITEYVTQTQIPASSKESGILIIHVGKEKAQHG